MPDDDLPGGDMTACMVQMQDDGYAEDEAARICESLQAEAEADHGNVEELRESIRRGAGLIADVGVELNSAVDRPAINSKWVMFKSAGGDAPAGKNTQIDAPLVLRKDDDGREEKRIAYAPAMIPRELDKEGDVVPTPTVERAAHNYLKNDGGADSDHDLIDGKGEPVESWILPEAKTWDLPDGGSETYPAGTWMVGIEWDQETWKRIQEGELEGLSIYGQANHVELGKSAESGDGGEDGATPKSDAEESSKQESPMSDSESVEALEDRLDTLSASVEDMSESVEEVKEAVDTDKEPGESDGNALRDLAAALANHEEVSASAEDILSDLKAEYLSDKEDTDDADEMPEEGDDEADKADDEDEDEEDDEAEKSVTDPTPNYGKGVDGSDSAVTAKDEQNTDAGVPSYAAAADAYEEDK